MLDEGVYILLTSRLPEEENVPRSLGESLAKLEITETCTVKNDAETNTEFLRSYINHALKKYAAPKNVEILLERSGNRILYLGMLCRVLGHGMTIEELPDLGKVTETYLDIINSCYGEKESIRLREVLAVLCTLGDMEPLPLKVLAELTAEGQVNLRFLGIVRDLAPLLKVIRSRDGNQYTIATPGLAAELREQLPETKDAVGELLEYGLAQIREGYPPATAGLETVIGHIVDLAMLLPESGNILKEIYDGEIFAEFVGQANNKAEGAHERARLADYQKQQLILCSVHLGENADDTLTSMSNLLKTYIALAKRDEVISLAPKLYERRKGKSGEEHPDTIESLSMLAMSLFFKGEWDEQIRLLQKVYDLNKKVHGEDDPATIDSMETLAFHCGQFGDIGKALRLRTRIYELYKNMNGEEHPDTIRSIFNLVNTVSQFGRFDEASSLLKRALELSQRVNGTNHPDTISGMTKLAEIYQKAGEQDEASGLIKRTYEFLKKDHKENAGTADILCRLARLAANCGQYDYALNIEEEAFSLCIKVYGEDHMITAMEFALLKIFREKSKE